MKTEAFYFQISEVRNKRQYLWIYMYLENDWKFCIFIILKFSTPK